MIKFTYLCVRTFVLVISSILNVGQAQEKIHFFGAKTNYGFIIPHSPELRSISQTNPFGFELEYSRLKTSNKAWKTCFCYGKSGVAFSYYNYNNPDVLGSSYNLRYFVEPYFTYKGPLKLSLKGSIGATYLNRIFDPETNPTNVFFSTPLSFFLGISLQLNYHLNSKYSITLSGNYNHISNGGQKQPNKGMNFPTVSLGVDRILDYEQLVSKPDSIRAFSRKVEFYLGTFASLRSASRTEEATNHLLLGGTAGILKPLSAINGLNAGMEFWYDWSDLQISKNEDFKDQIFSSALMGGHHFKLGNFYFLQQFGIYVSRPKKIQPKWVFQRYSLWYTLKSNWTIGASLIAYGKAADHMDGRLLYTFN